MYYAELYRCGFNFRTGQENAQYSLIENEVLLSLRKAYPGLQTCGEKSDAPSGTAINSQNTPSSAILKQVIFRQYRVAGLSCNPWICISVCHYELYWYRRTCRSW